MVLVLFFFMFLALSILAAMLFPETKMLSNIAACLLTALTSAFSGYKLRILVMLEGSM